MIIKNEGLFIRTGKRFGIYGSCNNDNSLSINGTNLAKFFFDNFYSYLKKMESFETIFRCEDLPIVTNWKLFFDFDEDDQFPFHSLKNMPINLVLTVRAKAKSEQVCEIVERVKREFP